MRVIFLGSPAFAVPSLLGLLAAGHEIPLVVSQPDKIKGRKAVLTPTPVKEVARTKGLPVLTPVDINCPEILKELASHQPELMVTVAYGQIFKQPFLDLAPLGAINVHASLLPHYRGAAPIHWSIINGEKETGITIMHMAKGLDSGDIILQQAMPINPEVNLGQLYDALAEMGSKLLVNAVELLALGKAPRIPQDATLATYAPLLKREHEKLDWQRSAVFLANQVRGMNPCPGAFCLWQGKPLKIWQAEAFADICGKPGEILAKTPSGLLVACGNGALLLKEVQPAGKNKMPAEDWARGLGNCVGQYLS